ncbi:pentatricopeptide repeat-containing protein At2g15820, chloroplastic [Amaranthus tricolor]|uniref:pentatricopeptide repeat-containing protein At2g15820, chloroplastic n=1 Tax=Amaranthus tricolor TaxID=29722 RepID=UPI00258D7FCB|nr:pentatricopeptide repeat-containing protein At2g15820, chloroplastic [Amaranthus tricolor]
MLLLSYGKPLQLTPLSLLNFLPSNSFVSNPNLSSFSLPSRLLNPPFSSSIYLQNLKPLQFHVKASNGSLTSVEQLVGKKTVKETNSNLGVDEEDGEMMRFDIEWDGNELRKNLNQQFESPVVEMKELEEFPENWRRSKLAWLCKELPVQKRPTQIRLLAAQKKWMRQDDATYIALHFMRIRVHDSAFWVYEWMIQQHWYRFDFSLATKLADNMGRERKFAKCRKIFDDIINQGRVPSESTFHILIIAYLSASDEDCLKEACDIYNRMIHLGAYYPQLSLQNALFKAIVTKPANSVKQYLGQAEFIFHNLATRGLEIHKEIYGGLLWLHSYQDIIDKERMLFLLTEMHLRGIPESRYTLLSILRACSKEGDVDTAEKTWAKLLQCDGGIPTQAYVYKMDVYAKVGDSMKSLEIFRELQAKVGATNIVAYRKIIEIMCTDQHVELVGSLMEELIRSGLKSLTPSYVDLLNMYNKLNLHDKVESTFLECLDKCEPTRTLFSIYLDSLVKTSNVEKAESIFNQMLENEAIGAGSRSCNTLLYGYISCGDNLKAEKLYKFMRQKNYEVDSSLMEKLDNIFSSQKKVVSRKVKLKLTPEQREILVGLLLGGLQIEYAGKNKLYFINFEFKDNPGIHSILKRHIYNKFHEWVQHSDGSSDDTEFKFIPSKFLTVAHTCFGFYADQFWANGRQTIPKLIHRWLSPRVLAYWFMHGGYTTPTGDIVLKVKGSKSEAERVFKALKSYSLDFRIKQKGKVFWLGFIGSHCYSFRKLIEPYLLDDLQNFLKADKQPIKNSITERSNYWSSNESDFDDSVEPGSGFSDSDDALF